MGSLDKIIREMQFNSDPEKGKFLQRFFKTGPGQYGEGDIFLGLSVPQQREISKKFYKEASLEDIRALLYDAIHEHRLTALIMLSQKFASARDESMKTSIAEFYLEHAKQVNNWDLVDSSADRILGAYLFEKDRSVLYKLAESSNLWEQRISIMATYYFIKKGDFEDTLKIAERLLGHKHDLIHKALGWMLREIGKRDFETEYAFLAMHYKKMPRTMLRYAIEKFEEPLRQRFLKGQV